MNRRRIFGFTANVFFLGLVSLLTDASSEMIFTLLPLFLTNVLGASLDIVGLLEGIAEATASLMKIASGWFSDRLGKRKALTAGGYAFSTLTKPFMLLANSWGVVIGVRFADRLGKGVRSAPRDALLAESMDKSERGKGFGFHRAMDTAGAFLGIGGAALIVWLTQQNAVNLEASTYRLLVIVGIVPAVISLFMFLFVHEPRTVPAPIPAAATKPRVKPPLPRRFYLFLGVLFLFTLANFGDGFLTLRAQNLGGTFQNSTFMVLIMLVLFNAVYALVSTPAGILSDKLGRKGVILLGWGLFILVRLGFGFANAEWQVWTLFAVWGLYYATTEGTARALVADMVPAERRGYAYGLYYTAVGIAVLPANIIVGKLWDAFNSPAVAFSVSAGLALLAMVAFALVMRGYHPTEA
jgi:MFS family permease